MGPCGVAEWVERDDAERFEPQRAQRNDVTEVVLVLAPCLVDFGMAALNLTV